MSATAIPRPSVGGVRQMIKKVPSKLILFFVRWLPRAERADAAVPECGHFQTRRCSALIATLIMIIWLIMIIGCWALGRVAVRLIQQFS